MGKRGNVSHGVCKGLPFLDGELMRSSDALRNRIVKVIARISEASYRRGIQHGAKFRDNLGGDVCKFRSEISIDKAPMADVKGFPEMPGAETATDRLDIEYGYSLSDWGLSVERSDGRQVVSLCNEKYARKVREIGRKELSDAEVIGGAFCDGIANGVPGNRLHEAYMDSHGADQFEAAVWREIDMAKRQARRND